MKRTKKKWQRSGKEVTDPAVKALTKALVNLPRLLLRLSPLSLKKGVGDIIIQMDFKGQEEIGEVKLFCEKCIYCIMQLSLKNGIE